MGKSKGGVGLLECKHPYAHFGGRGWRSQPGHVSTLHMDTCKAVPASLQDVVAQHTAQHTGDAVSPCIREPSVGNI